MKIHYLDGEKLYYAFFFGRKEILKKQSHLNKINVFPVADGDTGTNLASTMHSIIEGTSAKPSVAVVSQSMAEAALSGSRGNSGIIFAQFVQGISEAVRNKEYIDKKEFAHAVKNGVEFAYKAISKPVEGTILTVMRSWSNALHALHDKTSDFNEFIHHSLLAAKKTLMETPKKLKILEKAGVVDAGAEGFVSFLEGLAYFIRHGTKPAADETIHLERVEEIHPEVTNGNIRHRYCAEALLKGNNLNAETIRRVAIHEGDSLIVAGNKERMKIHIHTNAPAELVHRLKLFGSIIYQKVDDMKKQYEIRFHRKTKIALVTDSSCDLPQELIDEYQIHVVPLNISFGETQYLDKITLTPEQFYILLDQEREVPTTSQPTVGTFENLYRYLLTHYDSVISVHLARALSGTWNAAKIAADKLSRTKISVIDSKQISVSLGLVVQRIVKEILSGKPHEEVVRLAENFSNRAKLLVSVKTLKYMVRSGRVSPLKGALAKILNLKPIVSLDREGASTLSGKAFSSQANIKKILKIIEQRHNHNPIQNYAIVHTKAEKEALRLEEKVEQILGKKSDYILSVSPVIGSHVGTGVLGLGIL